MHSLDAPAWIPFRPSAPISFMKRFWGDPKEQYARSSLLPKGQNGKMPKKELGDEGKLVELEPDKYTTKNLMESILNGTTLSNGYQAPPYGYFHTFPNFQFMLSIFETSIFIMKIYVKPIYLSVIISLTFHIIPCSENKKILFDYPVF